jgi:3-methylcrotonyl-CoA carboxylase beta subunit
MTVLHSRVDTQSDTFRRNREAYDAQRAEIASAQEAAVTGGGAAARERHKGRGKLLARERIAMLLDPGTAFLEIGQLGGHGVYEDAVPCAGIVTGVGVVCGRACAIVANDATVKGGTYYPLTIRKHVRAQQVARENALPCIYLVDSGGAFLPLQEEIFPDENQFGRIFRNIAELSAMGLTQIAAVLGSCTAGGAYVPAMCDETVIVRDSGTIFLGGPQLVRAATGTVVDPETLGGADVHTRKSGVADHYAMDDRHALSLVREIVARPGPGALAQPPLPDEPPLYDPAEIGGIISANPREPISSREILARILDGSRIVPYRDRYGPTVICGTGAIGGFPVGVIINDGVLFSESAQKATNFIELCSQTGTPLVFLHNISGFMVGPEYEAGGIAKDGAKMINAVSCARVPKFSLLIGGSYGAGNFAMCGRAFGPRLMGMWPNARTSVMGGEQAAMVLTLVRAEQLARRGKAFLSEDEEEAFKQPIRAAYEEKGRPLYAAARMWVDAVVDPIDTRAWLALGLALAAGAPKEETRFGVFRM